MGFYAQQQTERNKQQKKNRQQKHTTMFALTKEFCTLSFSVVAWFLYGIYNEMAI